MLASHARKTAERLTTALVRRANAYADATFVIPTVRRASPATELERVARDVQLPNACRHLEGFASFGLARPDDPRVLSTPTRGGIFESPRWRRGSSPRTIPPPFPARADRGLTVAELARNSSGTRHVVGPAVLAAESGARKETKRIWNTRSMQPCAR